MSGSNADNSDYPFRDIPLKPAIVQYLVRQLYSGKLVARQVIVEEVTRAHISEGGLKPTAENHDSIFKKALTEMKDKGEAENASPGYWRFRNITGNEVAAMDTPIEESSAEELHQSTNNSVIQPVVEPLIEVELGKGPSAVYVYYLPTYRLRAEERGEKSWPCKIGRTDRDPLSRVLSQAATALPERPHIAIVLRTHFPGAWEAVLHGALTIRGMKIENLPGVEWFVTSPDEIICLVKTIDPSLFASSDLSASLQQKDL